MKITSSCFRCVCLVCARERERERCVARADRQVSGCYYLMMSIALVLIAKSLLFPSSLILIELKRIIIRALYVRPTNRSLSLPPCHWMLLRLLYKTRLLYTSSQFIYPFACSTIVFRSSLYYLSFVTLDLKSISRWSSGVFKHR